MLDHGLPLLMEKPLVDALADAGDLVLQSGEGGRAADVRPAGAVQPRHPDRDEAARGAAARHRPGTRRTSPRIRSGVATDLLIHDVDIAVRMMGAEPALVRGSLGYLHPDSHAGLGGRRGGAADLRHGMRSPTSRPAG